MREKMKEVTLRIFAMIAGPIVLIVFVPPVVVDSERVIVDRERVVVDR